MLHAFQFLLAIFNSLQQLTMETDEHFKQIDYAQIMSLFEDSRVASVETTEICERREKCQRSLGVQ